MRAVEHDLNATVRLKSDVLTVGSFRVDVIAGADLGATAAAVEGKLTVGTADDATLRLTDPTVSRYHVEFEATAEGVLFRDLGSTNGTVHGAALVREGRVLSTTDFRVGRSALRLVYDGSSGQVPISAQRSFGALLGASAAMRRVYAMLEKAAPTRCRCWCWARAARARSSPPARCTRPRPARRARFEVVDCGGLPPR
jgi:hypothetical protein